tara:strand:+ start:457 stop:624 length:168 start_codon:yes stop_codon:yes gene_type:complete
MKQLLVLIEGKEVMINESKLLYFQEALGAKLVGEVKEEKVIEKKAEKKQNFNKKK